MSKISDLIFKNKIFLKNILLNIIGFTLITGTVQLILYPFLSRTMEQSEYGLAITLIGFSNVFTIVFGNALTNTRLRQQSIYEKKNITGDFNLLFISSVIMNMILVVVLSYAYDNNINILDLFLLASMSFFAHFRAYFSVHFRLYLNFKQVLIMNMICSIGYIIGMQLSKAIGIWQVSFLTGELAGAVYIFFKNKIIKESLKITSLFKPTTTTYLSMVLLLMLRNITVYADRLLIYPMLGGNEVAVYYTSVFFGKTIGTIATPIAGVILSHYSKKTVITRQDFWARNVYVFLLSLSFIALILMLGRPITAIFYPTLIDQALPYLNLANLAAIIFFSSVMIYPAIIKFCNIRGQLILQGITVVIYILTSYILIKKFELIGFCYAMLITSTLNLIMLLAFGNYSINHSKFSN